MVETPKIYDASVTDTENGVLLKFSLDEGLEESNEQFLWCRARIRESNYFQPLGLNIMPGGKTAEAIVEPGKVQDGYCVEVEWYFEQYPEREKSDTVKLSLTFEPDWFDLSAFEHEARSEFERKGIEMQAQEAARFRIVGFEEAQEYPHAALNITAGLWMLEKPGSSEEEDYVGIAPDQPDMGVAWRAAWFPQVLERSREIRKENGWDDGQNH